MSPFQPFNSNIHEELKPLRSRENIPPSATGIPIYSPISLKGRKICFIRCASHIAKAVLRTLVYVMISAFHLIFFCTVMSSRQTSDQKKEYIRITLSSIACIVVVPTAQILLTLRAAAGIIHPGAYFVKEQNGPSKLHIEAENNLLKICDRLNPKSTKNLKYMLDVSAGRQPIKGRQLTAHDRINLNQIYNMLIDIHNVYCSKDSNGNPTVSDDQIQMDLHEIASVYNECIPAWYKAVLSVHQTVKEPILNQRLTYYARLTFHTLMENIQPFLSRYRATSLGNTHMNALNLIKKDYGFYFGIFSKELEYDEYAESFRTWLTNCGYTPSIIRAMLLTTVTHEAFLEEIRRRINTDHNENLRFHLLTELHDKMGGITGEEEITQSKYTVSKTRNHLTDEAIRILLKDELEKIDRFVLDNQAIKSDLDKWAGLEGYMKTFQTKLAV